MMSTTKGDISFGSLEIGPHVPADIPEAGLIISTVVSMLSMGALSVCLVRRMQSVTNWRALAPTMWLLFAIYVDSLLFVFATAILRSGWGLNSNTSVCAAVIMFCLCCYMTAKLLIYFFLVEKVYIVQRVTTSRLKSKLYMFNCLGLLLPYIAIVVLNFTYRFGYFDETGMCIVGMEEKAMLPLVIYDGVVNLYLTALFIAPVRSKLKPSDNVSRIVTVPELYSYKNQQNSVLRTMALHTFYGSLAMLASSIANLSLVMILRGEAAWVCLLSCNTEIIFSTLVLHWVTHKDSRTRKASTASLSRTHTQTIGSSRTKQSFRHDEEAGQFVRELVPIREERTVSTRISSLYGENAALRACSPADLTLPRDNIVVRVCHEQTVERENDNQGTDRIDVAPHRGTVESPHELEEKPRAGRI